jgi:hypothetical protein
MTEQQPDLTAHRLGSVVASLGHRLQGYHDIAQNGRAEVRPGLSTGFVLDERQYVRGTVNFPKLAVEIANAVIVAE